MTKIEEILERYNAYPESCFYQELIEALQLYAELYAKKVLELAAEKANIQINTGTKIYYLNSFDNKEFPEHESFINKESITNIQLPPHE